MPFAPNTDLVITTYLKSLNLGPAQTFGVGTTLPEDTSSWKDGFIQVSVVGGSPNVDVPTRSPLVQVDCWVPSINSSKPQWGKANVLADTIIDELYSIDNIGIKLSLGPNFKDAHIQTSYAVGEPRRILNDPAGHARYSFDVTLNWVAA